MFSTKTLAIWECTSGEHGEKISGTYEIFIVNQRV
jgi:hypothetical protein